MEYKVREIKKTEKILGEFDKRPTWTYILQNKEPFIAQDGTKHFVKMSIKSEKELKLSCEDTLEVGSRSRQLKLVEED